MSTDVPEHSTRIVWERFSDRLRAFVSRRVTSAQDADDILQTVFLQIHIHLATLRESRRLEAWLYRVTRNAIADHFRTQRRTEDGIAEPAIDDRPDEENLNPDVAACLKALIDHLPPDQRDAIRLYEFDGLSQQEIARRQGLSLSGVKSRIQRGRRRLAAILTACCEFQFDRLGNILDYQRTADPCPVCVSVEASRS